MNKPYPTNETMIIAEMIGQGMLPKFSDLEDLLLAYESEIPDSEKESLKLAWALWLSIKHLENKIN